MPVHENYERVLRLVDAHFVSLCRAARARTPDVDRMDVWHDALEAALKADKEFPGEPAGDWEETVLGAARIAVGEKP
jgi:DNA-directed RNA polymerase specialized sigma24 family protein